jgi:hypothetical protein
MVSVTHQRKGSTAAMRELLPGGTPPTPVPEQFRVPKPSRRKSPPADPPGRAANAAVYILAAAPDELTEPALVAAACLLLVEEGRFLFAIFVGEVLPGNFFEGFLAPVTREVDAKLPASSPPRPVRLTVANRLFHSSARLQKTLCSVVVYHSAAIRRRRESSDLWATGTKRRDRLILKAPHTLGLFN